MHESINNTTLSLHCPAKLNLTLAVGAPREDGLHPIASVMVAMDFGDELYLIPLDNGPSTFERRFADDAPKPQPIDWPIESDLAYRAHALLEEYHGRDLPISCEMVKRIPTGAGLGGGSSNAAAMLVGLRRLYMLTIDDQSLLQLAQQLGADVVFLIRAILGQPAALVTGVGEAIEPLQNIHPFDCVLVFPDGQCPTPAVYRAFDELTPDASIEDGLIRAWSSTPSLPAAHNDLQDAAIHVCPPITQAIQTITGQQFEPRLTGSGSALFSITQSKAEAVAIAQAIRNAGYAAQPASYTGLPPSD